MDDVFYFSQSDVDLQNLATEALEVGFAVQRITNAGLSLHRSEDPTTRVHIAPLDSIEEEDLAVVTSSGVKSWFTVSHHRRDVDLMKSLVKRWLTKFGGWVGNDDDLFSPRFSLEDIDSFVYPE